jgi:hypothetical protein
MRVDLAECRVRLMTPTSALAQTSSIKMSPTINKPRREGLAGDCWETKTGVTGRYDRIAWPSSAVVRDSNRCVFLGSALSPSSAVFLSVESGCDSTGAPHERQKLVPGTISRPHFAQRRVTMKTKIRSVFALGKLESPSQSAPRCGGGVFCGKQVAYSHLPYPVILRMRQDLLAGVSSKYVHDKY